MIWTWLLVAAALGTGLAVTIHALRRPILFRMAARNALRRPKQTATVIAGLMVGTAIISAALVAGQSATSAIREVVYDSLGEIDETVRINGYPFFPEGIADELAAQPGAAWFDGIAPTILWGATGTHDDLYEPGITLIGFDKQRDKDFGEFALRGRADSTGADLAAGHVYVTAELAEALELQAGDQVEVALTRPVDPLLPTITRFSGVVGLAFDAGDTLPIAIPVVDPVPQVHDLDIGVGTTQIALVLVCAGDQTACAPGTQLRVHADDPSGRRYSFTGPAQAAQQPPTPAFFNVTAAPGGVLASGEWSLTVTGTLAAQAPYQMVAVALKPVYDLEELQRRAEELEQDSGIGLEDFGEFGDRVEATFTVAAITDGGKGGQFGFLFPQRMFIDLAELQDLLHRPGEVNLVKLSNPGDAADGGRNTAEALRLLETALESVKAGRPDQASVQALVVNPAKRDSLQQADDAGELMTGLMIFAGSLSIITGLLLIVNIFTMLAEERRSELGMARAVGLTRRDLVRVFLFEGSLYAVAAAFIGAVLGLGLAWIMITGLNLIIADSGLFPAIPFRPSATAIPIAFAAGALLTFITIVIASRRQSRLNIVRAIRQIDDPPKSGAWWLPFFGLPLAAIGLTVAVIGWILPQFSMQVFGPLGFAIGMMVALRRWLRRKIVDTAVATVLAIYYGSSIYLITDFANITEANLVGPIRAVIMTLCVVILFTYWQTGPRLLGRLLSVFRRLRAVALPAVSYPQHKRFRTGMTLAMFAIVILSIGFFSIFGGLFQVDPARQTGGFDVEGRPTLEVPDLAVYDEGLLDRADIESQHEVRVFTSFEREFITVEGGITGHFGPPIHRVYGVDGAFIDDQDFRLLWTLDDASMEATYARLMTDPDAIIVSYEYSTDERNQDLSHEVGERLTMHIGDCRDPVTAPTGTGVPCPVFTIIGIQEQYHFSGVFLPKERVASLFAQTDALHLVKLNDGVDAEEFAKEFERNYRGVGMDAAASKKLVEDEQESFRQILGAMKVFLGLGLIVGVLSLGIITSRSVLERRQEIGMMRALGFTGRQIRRIFFIEVTLIIALGALIGIVCSIIVTYGLWYAIIRELQYPYQIPWGEIGWLLGASYLVALLATLAPILRAAKVAPAEALRYIE